MTRKIEENIERMNALASQIIEVSVHQAQSANENLKYRLSMHKQQRQSKNEFIGKLMTLVAECRNMNLNQADKAKLDTALSKLNRKLYEATSLTIV